MLSTAFRPSLRPATAPLLAALVATVLLLVPFLGPERAEALDGPAARTLTELNTIRRAHRKALRGVHKVWCSYLKEAKRDFATDSASLESFLILGSLDVERQAARAYELAAKDATDALSELFSSPTGASESTLSAFSGARGSALAKFKERLHRDQVRAYDRRQKKLRRVARTLAKLGGGMTTSGCGPGKRGLPVVAPGALPTTNDFTATRYEGVHELLVFHSGRVVVRGSIGFGTTTFGDEFYVRLSDPTTGESRDVQVTPDENGFFSAEANLAGAGAVRAQLRTTADPDDPELARDFRLGDSLSALRARSTSE